MGLPKMPPEYAQPNLCGANAGLGDVQKKMDDALKNLTDRIEFSASDIKEKFDSDLADFKEKLSKLNMPSLPSLPDVSLQSEMTSIASINTSTLSGRIQKEAKKLSVKNLFGPALTKAGQDFDSVLDKVESAIAGGGDACSACKNFMVKAGGTSEDASEKPANTMTADFKSQKEEVSTVTTAAKAEGVGLSNLFGFLGSSTPILTDTLGKTLQIINEGGPNMNERLEEHGKETEEKLKTAMIANGIPIHPGVAKQENEIDQNNSLYEVDEVKAKAEPLAKTNSKDSAFKASTGASETLQEKTNIVLLYGRKFDEMTRNLIATEAILQRITQLIKKTTSPYPQNLADETGNFIFSDDANITKFRFVEDTLKNFWKVAQLNREDADGLARTVEDKGESFLANNIGEWEGRIKNINKTTGVLSTTAEVHINQFWVNASPFKIPTPPAGSPGGPKGPTPFELRLQREGLEQLTRAAPKGSFVRASVKTKRDAQTGLILIEAVSAGRPKDVPTGNVYSSLGSTAFEAAGNWVSVREKFS